MFLFGRLSYECFRGKTGNHLALNTGELSFLGKPTVM